MVGVRLFSVALVGCALGACSADSGPKEVGGTAAGAVAAAVSSSAAATPSAAARVNKLRLAVIDEKLGRLDARVKAIPDVGMGSGVRIPTFAVPPDREGAIWRKFRARGRRLSSVGNVPPSRCAGATCARRPALAVL